ncbi:DUF3060 domain-containing protein [Actinophytocola sp.]|uniref:DUF3060 domain-containing protein n=1 Tax=Actinophytocola sp. TaxID=1872138 RepID=UPI002ED2528F
MRIIITTIATIGLLSLVSACDSDNEAANSSADLPAGTTTEQTSSSQPVSEGQCPVGEWTVTAITGKSGATVGGVPVVAKSGSGFTLTLTADNTWTLAGDNARVTLEGGGLSVDATVDGTAEGDYVGTGETYTFRQQRASGRVTLDREVAGVSAWSMDEVGPALMPGGQATLTCGPGTLEIGSESVVLVLRAVGEGSQTTEVSETPEQGGGGGTVTIDESGVTRTVDCAGQDVVVNGSANELTFTGTCASVTVAGSSNEVRIADTGEIVVNGSVNRITWSEGDPKTEDNGQGNSISRG